MIRLAKKEDIKYLAPIYKDLYDDADIGENWTIEKSEELLNYWYNKQGDLFFVAEEDGKPVGAIMSGVKSWFDGLRLVDTEIFVSKDYQEKHLGRALMLEHLKQAKVKYNVKTIEFHTYGDETEFPQNWYNRIGFKKDEELVIMNADVEEVLGKLGYTFSNQTESTPNIMNYSYNDLSKLYSNLEAGDKAYIFDMLPEYAYLDNKDERDYIESRITAMKNGAEVNLFIVGDKNRLKELESNKLFNYAIKSRYNNSNIYIIDNSEIKEKSPVEYFQLAKGLYLGQKKDGSKEIFRDLWMSRNNIGLLIKDIVITNYIEECVNIIVDKINNKEIKCIQIISSK